MSDIEPYENTLSLDELRQEVRRGWDDIRYLTDAIRDVPDVPPVRVLLLLDRASTWPRDFNLGKQLQREVGSAIIPYKTECETGAGVWVRIRQGLLSK